MLMQLHTPTVQPKCRTLNYQDYVQTITQSLRMFGFKFKTFSCYVSSF